jgi:hypothetical protein
LTRAGTKKGFIWKTCRRGWRIQLAEQPFWPLFKKQI